MKKIMVSLGLSTIVGILMFIIVSEILRYYIFFSVFLGIPVGIISSVLVMWYLK